MGTMKMPKEFYRTGQINSGKITTKYSGEIYNSDFEGKYYCSDITNRIIKDRCFDRSCKKNIECRARKNKYAK